MSSISVLSTEWSKIERTRARLCSLAIDFCRRVRIKPRSRMTVWLPGIQDVSPMYQLRNGQIIRQSFKVSPIALTLLTYSVLIEASYHLTEDWTLNLQKFELRVDFQLPTHNSSVINHNLVELTRIWMEFLLNLGHITFNLMKFNLKML